MAGLECWPGKNRRDKIEGLWKKDLTELGDWRETGSRQFQSFCSWKTVWPTFSHLIFKGQYHTYARMLCREWSRIGFVHFTSP